MAIQNQPDQNGTCLTIYPNPNNGFFQIVLKNLRSHTSDISVYDLVGKQIYRNQESSISISTGVMIKDIDLSAFSKGIYIVQVRDGESVYNSKIIVQ
jgi:hypothetical protein